MFLARESGMGPAFRTGRDGSDRAVRAGRRGRNLAAISKQPRGSGNSGAMELRRSERGVTDVRDGDGRSIQVRLHLLPVLK